MKIGVTGATGQLGQIVVDKLKEKVGAANIVALVRNPEKAVSLGVEAREFDYSKSENLTASLKGLDSLLLISGNEMGQRAAQHANVIKAAKEAGVKRIVYTSLLHANVSTLSLASEHLATEVALKASGVTYTILRNGWYIENYVGAIQSAASGHDVIGSAVDGRISAASRADYAEAAVTVLTEAGHEGQIYELAGDAAFTLTDLAAELSNQTEKTIKYNNLPEAQYADILKSFGLPEELALAIAGWDVSTSNGALFDDSHELSKLIGRATTPMSAVVANILATK